MVPPSVYPIQLLTRCSINSASSIDFNSEFEGAGISIQKEMYLVDL